MRHRGRRREILKPAIVAAAVLAVAGVLLWLLWFRGGPPTAGVFGARLAASTGALVDHRQRVEARLRLQLLAAEMQAGRRSDRLRAGYRMVDESIEPLLANADAEERERLETELEGLQVALSRERTTAFERIRVLTEELMSSAGPGRQGAIR